ncbi:ABC transporter ATP-binding protein [Halosimplex salinum]|uniref:ABC transporter ATP-binding protein n=1 Tax=Halosimplex salinum TaxID=1710538 RepID=UPI000F49E769|nr:ABC transporter ATP-binding protein [Halosimplex salinum]
MPGPRNTATRRSRGADPGHGDETPAIDLDGVTKRYGDVTALERVSLTVASGEIFGFLGPNGAGKTTLINLLLGFSRPTAGEVCVLGLDVGEHPQRVCARTGVLHERGAVYDRLTGREHVEFAVESAGSDEDPTALLSRVGLAEEASRRAGEYSKGMAQRLLLGMALAGSPDLLILDEPSTGLDPNGARELREIVRAEADRGATVFFSSHVLDQVEAVCDRVGILHHGELIAVDSIDGLRATAESKTTLTVEVDRLPDGVVEAVEAVQGVAGVTVNGTTATVSCDGTAKRDVLSEFEAAGATVETFETSQPSLEDLFVGYTTGTGDDR